MPSEEPLPPVPFRAAAACGRRIAAQSAPASCGRRLCFITTLLFAGFAPCRGSNALATPVNVRVAPGNITLRAADAALLDELEARAVMYFVDQSDPRTGLTRDRASNREARSGGPASIAATGFALAAWCIADSRGWLPPGEAARHGEPTLQFAAHSLPHDHGWFYHFVDPHTGRRALHCEVSTIDTALFLEGAIFAREYLRQSEISRLVDQIYDRVDWNWARNGAAAIAMGWEPESGFLPSRWDSYCELMGLYLLGLGAPSHPLPSAAWDAWRRPKATIGGRTFIACGPLFTHQYSHAWFDFRGVRDRYADYWRNSVDATLAQRTWCAAQQERYPGWSANLWGLTASDSPHGYVAWGTPLGADDESDGTLVPSAPGGSLPFAPRECLAALRQMKRTTHGKLWGRYGFADAFNPQSGWVSPDVIGIDTGIMLVMAENLRTGLVWRHFMAAAEVRRGMRAAGFASCRPSCETQMLPGTTNAGGPDNPAQTARRETFRIYVESDGKHDRAALDRVATLAENRAFRRLRKRMNTPTPSGGV